MKLTRYTDYSLRVLMYLGIHQNQRVTANHISENFNISRNHLMKIIQSLSKRGYIHTYRGNSGGIMLAQLPAEIVIGKVVREMERKLDPIDCFNPTCPIVGACRLQDVLGEARDAFFGALDRYTLADLLENQNVLAGLLVSG